MSKQDRKQDWEALHGELERATGAWTRDELVALLRDLIREYVVERGLPTGTPAQAATPDLGAMDFPQLITWLKRTVELPELGLFTVEGRRVLVEADGPRVLSADPARRNTGQWPATRAQAPAGGSGDTAPYPASGGPPGVGPANTGPAQAPPLPAADDDAGRDTNGPPRKLSKGFHGLEFD